MYGASSCCLVEILLCVAVALSDLCYKVLITKFGMNYFFFSSATNAKKYGGILYRTDAFLGFLLISGSDSKLPFSLNLLEACWGPRLSFTVVLLLSYVEQGFLLAMWNISTSINSLFDIFSQQNPSVFIFVSIQVSIKMPPTLMCTFKIPFSLLIFREEAFVAYLLQKRKYISIIQLL